MCGGIPRRSTLALVLAALASPSAVMGQAGSEPEAAAEGLEPVAFFVGEWDVESLAPDGERVVGRARTDVRWILDGKALQADYYGLDPQGNAVFRGTTFRTWAPAAGRFSVHWSMAELTGYTYLEEEFRDGVLHGEGHGLDAGGEFIERYRYFDLSDSTYTFEMSRSYDDGATWSPYAHLRATKR